MRALAISTVGVSVSTTGTRIEIFDLDRTVQLIALLLMGQAAHARHVITTLSPATRVFDIVQLRDEAKAALEGPSTAHRDGLLLEMLSWIAAVESVQGECLIKDPHLSATTQGLDGIMLELDFVSKSVQRVVIFEDKCSSNPRRRFRDETLPAFISMHSGARSAEILSASVTLLKSNHLSDEEATRAAESALDPLSRTYRAGLAVADVDDNPTQRTALFKDFETLEGIPQSQRIGASFITGQDMRLWFEGFASSVYAAIDRSV